MMKQYLSKVTEFFKAPVTNGLALGSAAVAVMVTQRDFLMELATKKKVKAEEKSAANLRETAMEDVKAEKSEAGLKENAE